MPRGQPRVPAGFRTGGQFTKSNVAKRPKERRRPRSELDLAALRYSEDPTNERAEDEVLDKALEFAESGKRPTSTVERLAVRMHRELDTGDGTRAALATEDLLTAARAFKP